MKKKKFKIYILDFDDIGNHLLGAGQAIATSEVGKRLVNKGHSVTVVCSKYPGFKDRVENGIRYKHIGIGSNNVRLNNLFYIFSIPFVLRNVDADIIIECFTAPISTLFSPLFTDKPVIAVPTSFEAERFSKLYHLPFHWIEKIGLRFYKYFLPYNKFFEDKMRKYSPNVVTKIVPQGINSEALKIKRTEPKHILFLGRLDMGQKGIDLLLEAYLKVKDEIGYPLAIAGNGPDEQKVKDMVNNMGLEKNVKFYGRSFGKKKIKLMQEAAFVVIPSRHEGFCIFALEALAAGIPLVTFDIPGLSWVPKNIALKVPAFETKKLSKSLIKAKSDFPKSLDKNCKKVARGFTWDDISKKYEDFLFYVDSIESVGKSSMAKVESNIFEFE